MSAWSDTNCDPVNPVFTAVPWNLPETIISVIKAFVSEREKETTTITTHLFKVSQTSNYSLDCACSDSCIGHGLLCLIDCSIWWFFCKWC